MAAFHRRLSFAQIALDKGDFKGALTHADSALELDATSYEAHLYVSGWAQPSMPLLYMRKCSVLFSGSFSH